MPGNLTILSIDVGNRTLVHPEVNQRWLEFSFWTAGANWVSWRNDFEHGDDQARMPVLKHEARFLAFLAEYSLFQRQEIEARCKALHVFNEADLHAAFADHSGNSVEDLAIALQKAGKTKDTERSMLSKLAAFAVLEHFNALDSSAAKGVVKWAVRPQNSKVKPFPAHLLMIEDVLRGPLGKAIDAYLKHHQSPTKNIPGFKRRMLDVYLMVQGGRWAKKLSDTKASGL